MGKTALLGHLVAEADVEGFTVLRTVGLESESALPYAALHRLLPAFGELAERLPSVQRAALSVVWGREAGPAPDRFLVGVALLGLVALVTTERPLAVVVDDAQHLDAETREVLAFAARRLNDERCIVVFGVRTTPDSAELLPGIPRLALTGLDPSSALQLLQRTSRAPIEPRVASYIVELTRGLPLAIIELGEQLTDEQRMSSSAALEPIPLSRRLEAAYLARVERMPEHTQRWLLIAAAEVAGDLHTLAAASMGAGIDPECWVPAEAAGLITVDRIVRFTHPLLRSAVYGAAEPAARREAHRALAAVISEHTDADLRAWHAACGSVGTAEEVALALERAADRAAARGGYLSRAALLARAVELSADGPARRERALLAAEAAVMAGAALQALTLLEIVGAGADPVSRGRVFMVRAATRRLCGEPGAAAEAPALFLSAADQFASVDRDLAQQALLRAVEAGLQSSWEMPGTSLREIGERALRLTDGDERDHALILRAIGAYTTLPIRHAEAPLRRALAVLDSPELPPHELLRLGFAGISVPLGLWRYDALQRILERGIALTRAGGALWMLDALLYISAIAHLDLGELDLAQERLTEIQEVRTSLGFSQEQLEFLELTQLLAWRSSSAETIARIEAVAASADYLGFYGSRVIAHFALAQIALTERRYDDAYTLLAPVAAADFIQVSLRTLAPLVEAAVRSGRRDAAEAALVRLTEWAEVGGGSRAQGVLSLSRALLAEGDEARALYARAIELLSADGYPAERARAALLYGEWLRRAGLRTAAIEQLAVAAREYERMGALPLRERARAELAAAGADPATGAVGPLTAQQAEVARLAAVGRTNAEIATALVISPHTVDYHLRSVYRALGVTSRRELPDALHALPRD